VVGEVIEGKRKEVPVKDPNVMQVRAYAIIRGHNLEYMMTKKEVVMGRVCNKEEKAGTKGEEEVLGVSKSKKVSRKAVKVRYNEATE
jgi:hypothetical protein